MNCPICEKPETEWAYVVDNNRGVCNQCRNGLSCFNDDPDLIIKAAQELQKCFDEEDLQYYLKEEELEAKRKAFAGDEDKPSSMELEYLRNLQEKEDVAI